PPAPTRPASAASTPSGYLSHAALRPRPHLSRRGGPSKTGSPALGGASGGTTPAMRRWQGLLAGHHADHLQALVGVAPLVVVPGHQLDEGVVELDAGVHVEDRGARIAAEVGGHHL